MNIYIYIVFTLVILDNSLYECCKHVEHAQCPPGFRGAECHLPSVERFWVRGELGLEIKLRLWDAGTHLWWYVLAKKTHMTKYVFWDLLELQNSHTLWPPERFQLGYPEDVEVESPAQGEWEKYLRIGNLQMEHCDAGYWLYYTIWFWHSDGNFVCRTAFLVLSDWGGWLQAEGLIFGTAQVAAETSWSTVKVPKQMLEV